MNLRADPDQPSAWERWHPVLLRVPRRRITVAAKLPAIIGCPSLAQRISPPFLPSSPVWTARRSRPCGQSFSWLVTDRCARCS
jgi:hypothetical protein